MGRLLLHWLLSAVALLITAHVVPGFHVTGIVSALIASVVIGFFNATLGLLLKIITFPLSVVTFGLFLLVVNAVVLDFSSVFVPGFHVSSLIAAFWGAVVLAILQLIFGGFRRMSDEKK